MPEEVVVLLVVSRVLLPVVVDSEGYHVSWLLLGGHGAKLQSRIPWLCLTRELE